MKANRHIFSRFVPAAVLLIMLVAVPASGEPKEDYKKMPGYVEFGELKLLAGVEPSVEVLLRGPLLKLCQEAVRHDEPDLASALDEIRFVHVEVFPLDEVDTEGLSDNAKQLASGLEKKGWEMAVRVREDDEEVYIYILPGKKENIEGLVVMVLEDDDEAVLVNIVGNIDPAQIGRIGRSLDIDELEFYGKDSDDKKKRTN